jgi:ubiquinone/menaquinone biosynthesis C-methylase UbiE
MQLDFKQYDTIANFYYSNKNSSKSVTRSLLYKKINFLSNTKILDLGCGFGLDCEFFFNKGMKVYGVDISKNLIDIAKSNNPKIKYFVKNILNTSLKENYFDIIYSRYAIQYVVNKNKLFKEVFRLLKDNGQFIFLVPLIAKFNSKYHKFKLKENIFLFEPNSVEKDYFTKYFLKRFKILDIITSFDHNNQKFLLVNCQKQLI